MDYFLKLRNKSRIYKPYDIFILTKAAELNGI
jgi:hypothetical protein